jgi:thiol-disulfide isomerase/thioredoxin
MRRLFIIFCLLSILLFSWAQKVCVSASKKLPVPIKVYTDEYGHSITGEVFQERLNTNSYDIQLDSANGILSLVEHYRPVKEYLNTSLPNFSFTDVDGIKWNNKKVEGKLVIFHFWSTSCVPCVKEIPFLNSIKAANPDILFFALSTESSEVLSKFLLKNRSELAIIPNQQPLSTKLKINILPTTLIVDSKGLIKEVMFGSYSDSLYLQSKINKCRTQ